METKTCSKCKQVKELTCFPFYKYKGEKKRKAHCKVCQKALHKDWYEQNKEYAKKKRIEYVDKHRKEISEKKRKHYYDNIDKMKEKDRKRYWSNRDKELDRRKKAYWENPEKSRAYVVRKYYENIERYRELARKNAKNENVRERGARRRWLKQNATLNLTDDQIQQMRDMYWLAKDLGAVSGEVYEVDHIIPLRGKDICGLHVPWNLQILPRDLNRSKNNRYSKEDVFA